MGRSSSAYEAFSQTGQESNPLDVVEQVMTDRDWPYERESDVELTLIRGGQWTDFRLGVNYLTDCNALQLTLMFEARAPMHRQQEIFHLLALVNARNWLGHFDWWEEERAVMFRYGVPMREADLSAAQAEDIVDLALEACEMFYPALQYVLWSGMTAGEAVSACMMETMGEA
ncbi:MAG: hypothetical protein EXR08_11335 [Alphaproteobacteria bacterium]|nr:hypothetical protein [Alphaproteobacteria bacterium]